MKIEKGYVKYNVVKSSSDSPWRNMSEDLSIKVNWHLVGEGNSVIILINGFQEENDPVSKIVRKLAEDYRVLMVDIPGHIDGKPPILSFNEGADLIVKSYKRVKKRFNITSNTVDVCAFSLGGCIALAIKEQLDVDHMIMIGTPSGACPNILKLLESPESTTEFAKITTPGLHPRLLDMMSDWNYTLEEKEQTERSMWAEILNRDHIIGAIPKDELEGLDIKLLVERELLIPFERDGDYMQINCRALMDQGLVEGHGVVKLPEEYEFNFHRKRILSLIDRYLLFKPIANKFIYCHGENDPLVCKSSIRARIPSSSELITHPGGHFVTLERSVKIERFITNTLLTSKAISL